MYTQWDAAEVVAVRRARERARGERMRTAAAAGAFVDRMERLGLDRGGGGGGRSGSRSKA